MAYINANIPPIECYVRSNFLQNRTEFDEAKYNELLGLQNVDINWVEFMEETDTTTSAKELACSAGVCEI